MNFKKLSYYLLLTLLTLGASLIIGLLSFGGLYVLWPSIIFSSFAFVLSVAYEGEIYLQNIKGALNKLFNPNYLKLEIARSFLKDYFPHHLPKSQWPQFFKDYVATLEQLPCDHQTLDKQKRVEKREIEKKLKSMEVLFAQHLGFRERHLPHLSKDEQALHAYLMHYAPPSNTNIASFESLPEKYHALLKKQRLLFNAAQLFSALTAIFMSVGTTFLLLETFTVIPFLAAIPLGVVPFLILPMAIISGVAYGLLTYNTVTNIIKNDRVRNRFNKLFHDVKKNGLTWRNTLMITATLSLGALAVILTLCTAGTWWTIVKQTPPLFKWMRKIPSFIVNIVTPLVTSIAALAFNLENSCESLDMIDEAMKERLDLREKWADFKNKLHLLRQKENIGQLLNPFRIIIICTILPLELTFFLGHLISIGVTADRVPKLTKMFSACLGFISEFFEDLHYFVKHTHHQHDLRSLLDKRLSDEHGHDHDNNLPKRILNFIALPLYALSGLWDHVFSQFNQKKQPLGDANLFKPSIQPKVVDTTSIPKPKITAIHVQKTSLPYLQPDTKQDIQALPKISEEIQQKASECICCPKPSVNGFFSSDFCEITAAPPKRRKLKKQNEIKEAIETIETATPELTMSI